MRMKTTVTAMLAGCAVVVMVAVPELAAHTPTAGPFMEFDLPARM